MEKYIKASEAKKRFNLTYDDLYKLERQGLVKTKKEEGKRKSWLLSSLETHLGIKQPCIFDFKVPLIYLLPNAELEEFIKMIGDAPAYSDEANTISYDLVNPIPLSVIFGMTGKYFSGINMERTFDQQGKAGMRLKIFGF